MSRYLGRIRVMPRDGLLDPQGSAVAHALAALGFGGVAAVHVGRTIEITLEAASETDARAQLGAMGDRLLANPVTEDFAIDTVEPAA